MLSRPFVRREERVAMRFVSYCKDSSVDILSSVYHTRNGTLIRVIIVAKVSTPNRAGQGTISESHACLKAYNHSNEITKNTYKSTEAG